MKEIPIEPRLRKPDAQSLKTRCLLTNFSLLTAWGRSIWILLIPVLGSFAGAAPINDNFTNRIALAGVPAVTNGSNVQATSETGDPFVGGEGAYATVWYSWAAPSNGQYAVSVCMTNGGRPLVSVYTYWPGSWLTPVIDGSLEESYEAFPSSGVTCRVAQATFTAAPGTEYAIVVDARDGSNMYQGSFGLAVTVPAKLEILTPAPGADYPPLEDILLSAAVTDPDGEVQSVDYWNFFAGTNLAVCWGPPWSAVWSNLPAGSYRLLAHAVDNLWARTTVLRDFTVNRPVNDDFANRIRMSGLPALATGTTVAAGLEQWEPVGVCTYRSSRTVWWSWTAPSNGYYAVVASMTNSELVVGLYTWDSFGDPYQFLCSRGVWSAPIPSGYKRYSQANFFGVAGTNYEIMIGDGGPNPGTFDLALTMPPVGIMTSPTNRAVLPAWTPVLLSVQAQDADGVISHIDYSAPGVGAIGTSTQPPWSLYWSNPPSGRYWVKGRIVDNSGAQLLVSNLVWIGVTPPPNDNFAAAAIIPNALTNVSIQGSNKWASAETGEPYAQCSVWWSWTAPANRLVTVNATSQTINPYIGIYWGDSFSNLLEYSSGGPITFSALAGTTYKFQIDGGGEGNFTLTLSTRPLPPIRITAVDCSWPGTCRFQYNTVPGRTLVLMSEDLHSWSPIATNDNYGGGPMWFYDYLPTNTPKRFYRVQELLGP